MTAPKEEVMARFSIEIKGPAPAKIIYGFDRALGFFVDIKRPKKRRREYDATFPGYEGIKGLLDVLVEEGIATREEVEEALSALPLMEAAEIEDETVRRVGEIAENLKTAAGEG